MLKNAAAKRQCGAITSSSWIDDPVAIKVKRILQADSSARSGAFLPSAGASAPTRYSELSTNAAVKSIGTLGSAYMCYTE